MASGALSFAEAVCATVQAEIYFIQTRILEEENFLALLRQKAEDIANKYQEAQRQLHEVQESFPFLRTRITEDPLGKAHHMAVHAAYLGTTEFSSDDDDDSGGEGESGVGEVSGSEIEDEIGDGGEHIGDQAGARARVRARIRVSAKASTEA